MSSHVQLPGGEPDLERRFGGLRRLYGDDGYARLRAARVAVVGLGGVGSWAAEALARSGVAGLVLIDMDHVAESNINRQVQATGATLGRHKGEALRERVADIHPGCVVHVVDDFVQPDNWPALLGTAEVDVLIDACDQVRAKAELAAWGLREGVPVVCVGAAGGKRQAQQVEVADLALVTHDPLLASLRQRLRQQGTARPKGTAARPLPQRTLGVTCVFSRERVAPPAQACEAGQGAGDGTLMSKGGSATLLIPPRGAGPALGALNCHGYGSSVAVTATFGMVAAGEALALLLSAATPGHVKSRL